MRHGELHVLVNSKAARGCAEILREEFAGVSGWPGRLGVPSHPAVVVCACSELSTVDTAMQVSKISGPI